MRGVLEAGTLPFALSSRVALTFCLAFSLEAVYATWHCYETFRSTGGRIADEKSTPGEGGEQDLKRNLGARN